MKRHLTGLVKRGLRHAASDRSHPIEKLVLRSAGFARQPTDGQIDELAAGISVQLGPLLGAAMAGNVHALRKATELAAQLCAETTTVACLHQEAADVVARERPSWPLNVPVDPRDRRRAMRLVSGPRRLPLGNPAAHPSGPRKGTGLSHPIMATVLIALKAIEIERSFRIPSELFPTLQPAWSAAAANLPDLQPATAEAWFKVIWLYVCERHAGYPERSPLRRFVEDQAGAASPMAESAVRGGLRGLLEESFRRLVQGRERRGRPRR